MRRMYEYDLIQRNTQETYQLPASASRGYESLGNLDKCDCPQDLGMGIQNIYDIVHHE